MPVGGDKLFYVVKGYDRPDTNYQRFILQLSFTGLYSHTIYIFCCCTNPPRDTPMFTYSTRYRGQHPKDDIIPFCYQNTPCVLILYVLLVIPLQIITYNLIHSVSLCLLLLICLRSRVKLIL